MTRSKRRLSTPTRSASRRRARSRTLGAGASSPRARTPASTARRTSSPTLTSSRKTSTEPASARDISSRSPTMRWNRRRSSPRSCRARWARGGSSARSASSTSSDAARVVSGERNSWLTSELKRASRSIRAWIWSTMALNEVVRPSRSGSRGLGRQSGVELAAGDGHRGPGDRGQRPERRRLAKRPRAAPSRVVTTPAADEGAPSTPGCGRGRRGRTPRSRRRGRTGSARPPRSGAGRATR